MIDYERYEQDEIIRPRNVAKKPKTKKSNHKHDYRVEIRSGFSLNHFFKVEICNICQREGSKKLVRRDEIND